MCRQCYRFVRPFTGRLDEERGSVARLKPRSLAIWTGHLLTIKSNLSFGENKYVIQFGLKTYPATLGSVAPSQGCPDGEEDSVARSKPHSLAVWTMHLLTIKKAESRN